MSTQTVNPAVLAPLREALTAAYWFKPDLREFLNAATGLDDLVNRYDWTNNTKRAIVRDFVKTLYDNQHKYQGALVALIVTTPDIDPSALKRLDDGVRKYNTAVDALAELRKHVAPYRQMHTSSGDPERFEKARAEAKQRRDQSADINELKTDFFALYQLAPQARGYALEAFLTRLFEVHDISARGSIVSHGEQVDGAFTFDGADYLLEAKWEKTPANNADISTFREKIARRLDNTLGLFVAFNGFQETVLDLSGRSGRETVLLFDGSDLMAVLEERIPFEELLRRKKQHAARTGKIMLHAATILEGG